MLSTIFCMISLKLITYKSGNHDADLFLKIIGIILFAPAVWIVLESLNIIK
tara:strand:- start:1432 stop:1584 length:153 start_codon:yes stop_codon:yes gene_type:complete